MLVIGCDECRATLQAANDEELTRVLAAHVESEYDMLLLRTR